MAKATCPMSAKKFFQHLANTDYLSAYAVPLTTPGFQRFTDGLGHFHFVDLESAPPLQSMYTSRAFIYKNSYTDWHFHASDESVTVQLLGRKEFLLLPTDRKTFKRMWRIVQRHPGWEITVGTHPELQDVGLQKIILDPGDGLYIPVFWWHAVEAVDHQPGTTLAFTFSSPLVIQHDPRFAAVRWNFRFALSHRRLRRFVPLMVLGGLAALGRHPLWPPYFQRPKIQDRL
jgi:hypothetical protein